MNETVLITGASSGIGYEMAKLLAAQNYNLVLAARRIHKLQALAAELSGQYGISVYPIQADLSDPQNAVRLYEDIKSARLQVTMLVNNAGTGDYGNFIDIPLAKQVNMINVNITSLVVLSNLFLNDRRAAGTGRLMNIASILSYLPFPYYTVYSATKTFVLSFTETLAAEFEGTGIKIKALCPGPVDTGFNTSQMLNTNAYRSNKPLPAKQVAKVAVNHLLYGRGSKKVGFKTWFITNLPRITPDRLMMKIKKKLASQRTGTPATA